MDLSQMGDVSKGEPLDVMSCKFTLGMKFFMYFLVTFIVFFIVFGFLPTDMLNKLSSLSDKKPNLFGIILLDS